MSVEKRGNKWRVNYRHEGKIYKEAFDRKEDAVAYEQYVRVAKAAGTFKLPDKFIKAEENPVEYGKRFTIRELMERLLTEYGTLEWKPNVLSQNRHRIEYYINPLLGDETVSGLTVPRLERFYRDLQKTPSVDNPGELVGLSVIEKIHNLLNTAFRQAQRWGYISRDQNTVVSYAKYPKYHSGERTIWTPEEYQMALDVCEHHGVKVWLYLAVACSARIGELLGLQWKDVTFLENGITKVTIRQQLQRLDNEGMENSEKYEVYFTFPSERNSKTSLVLCGTKEKGGRTAPPRPVFLGPKLTEVLKEEKQRQAIFRALHGDKYADYDIVIAQENGRPYEEHDIRKHLKRLCVENDLAVVAPHAMRHLSVSLKLLWSGDVKAVQADSGHKDAEMVFNRYSHALDSERQKLAMTMDDRLYKRASG